MKKILCVLLTLLLFAGAAYAEGAAALNPNDYDLLKITDVFTNDGGQLTVQGCFGTTKGKSESSSSLVGFDKKEIRGLTLADDCVVKMPKDLMNPVKNKTVKDFAAWYKSAGKQMKDYLAPGESSYSFYASFEMNADGELTKIEYCYLP